MNLKPVDRTKTYLVTGAAGFIGMHLSKKLLSMGCKVIGYDNMNDYYDVNLKLSRLNILKKFDHFTFHKADLIDRDYLETLFSKNNIDIVINLAAQAGVRYSIENPHVYIQSNIVGFFNILEMCRHHKVSHLLYASSSSVYGSNQKIPFSTEDRVDQPVSLYAATKKSNELMAHTYSHLYKIPATGLRFFTVYGPYGRPDMAYYSFTKAIIEDKMIKVFNNGDMYRDFTYIDDIIEGVTRLIENSPAIFNQTLPYKVYNIGNNKPERLLDLIQAIEHSTGKKAKKNYFPMQAGDVYQTYADIKNLVEDVGFKPNTSIDDGINKFITWYNQYYNQVDMN
ncbi:MULTISPECIES: NAD-dependent epimerase [unclassified Paenibacillus]|uniref:NAD-dependent epimerase n=1 Tax=unclassified Paenibacillus TaxID=185978 RepID=UPI00240575CF|nr:MULTISPECIES: NAD-dependent epimerase [unclassified Paenibacillus]MDF9843625.1 UDP-glucuronate 4-epimerase [Paenibacillus sp. PastF-2]MDF9850213.1 UDP-glucuronate 4-epimerase [Paenibacillus sp. PastM-2]MDF9856846.1 UDP-glucuronate 4-epimerase [Paenibacillus sp. PastF-1]MDH6482060.1 UDP-glucuronate 4-epimerase [Paenibacillus sp. PastH-2]MDH6509484.1 UDP-glucuronate 4-epimerase [Paenibacillus sp. PastM-3]